MLFEVKELLGMLKNVILFSGCCFLGNLDLASRSPSMETKTSPPINIKVVIIISWVFEKTSISTVDMLETVAADTEVKNTSIFLGLKESVFGFAIFRAP